MDSTPPPQGRRGPWTRARTHAIENEVNSFLFELHSNSFESRTLPQMGTLCILRYFKDHHEESQRDHQVHRRPTEEEERNEKDERGGALDTPGARPFRSRVPGLSLGATSSWPRVPGLLSPGCPAPPNRRPSLPGCPTPLLRVPGPPHSVGPAPPGCPTPWLRVPG